MTSTAADTRPTENAWQELATSIGPEALRPAAAADAIAGVMPVQVATPDSEESLAAALAWAADNLAQVVPRGGGTKQMWANLPQRIDLVLSLARLNRILEHAWEDMTVTVQAGCTVESLRKHLALHGQRLAVDALFSSRATVGGIVACNDSGPLRLRFGSIRDLIIGATMVLPNGTIARSGGKVVKNVAGYDLPKLLTGSMGTLGVLAEATFRVHPLPRASRTLTFAFTDVGAANRFILDVLASSLVPAALQLRYDPSAPPRVDVLLEGIEAGVDAQSASLLKLASAARAEESSANTWASGETLFSPAAATSAVLKCSVLPSQIHVVGDALGASFASFRSVTQATGIGLVRVAEASLAALMASSAHFASAVREAGGTVTILDAPLEWKKSVDVFGAPTDSHPLMFRVKRHFDPHGILNAHRFVGGI